MPSMVTKKLINRGICTKLSQHHCLPTTLFRYHKFYFKKKQLFFTW